MTKKKILFSIVTSFFIMQNIHAKDVQKLEEVTVTAQKTEEKLQEVPASISVLDEFDIEDNNIRTLSDVAFYIPNYQAYNTGGLGMYVPSMRGLASLPEVLNNTIATYINGVPYLSTMGNNLLLEDIERVEVLRGPQGTLYGKNAYGGVINIITKKPDNETRGKIKIDLGEDNKREYTLNLSAPIVENKFYAGFSAKHYEKDGFIKNTNLNILNNDRKDDTIKTHLRYTPNDNLDISLISMYLKKDDTGANIASYFVDNPRETQAAKTGYLDSSSLSNSLIIDYDLDDISFSSVTSHKKYNDDREVFIDFPSVPMFLDIVVDSEYKNLSQEFKLDGTKEKFKWMTGVFLDDDKKDLDYLKNDFISMDKTIESNSIGVFGHIDYELSKDITLTGGLRYDKDRTKLDDRLMNYSDEKSDSEVSPKVGIKYNINADTISYVTISKGYKSGGYYIQAPSSNVAEYDKETLWNYEIGLKSTLLDGKLLLNTSLFYMDINNLQSLISKGVHNGYVANAAKATSKGLEIEADYILNENLKINANLGLIKSTYDDFQDDVGNYSGKTTTYAPKYNYSLGLTYRDNHGIFAKLDINGQGKYYVDYANKFENKAYAVANVKLGYEWDDYELYIYSNNITDERYDIEGESGGMVTMVSPPRETGISFSYRF